MKLPPQYETDWAPQIVVTRIVAQLSREMSITNSGTLTAVLAAFVAITGCQVAPYSQADSQAQQTVPYMTLDEFATVVDGDCELTLVEFCVPTGCARCDQMRSSIDQLAVDCQEQLTVRRVNLREQPALAWEFGVTVCPSYVVFRDGQEVYRAAYPVSADLISSGIEDSLSQPTDDQLSVIDR